MIKSIHCEEEPINRSRRSKTTNQQFKAQSKIKNLIAQDKFKFKKTRAPEYDFNKYEYSDDESEYLEQEPSKVEESEPQYEYSSFQQPNIPRQEVDVVSNSSSFSKFSLGSQREAGKISSRKKKEWYYYYIIWYMEDEHEDVMSLVMESLEKGELDSVVFLLEGESEQLVEKIRNSLTNR